MWPFQHTFPPIPVSPWLSYSSRLSLRDAARKRLSNAAGGWGHSALCSPLSFSYTPQYSCHWWMVVAQGPIIGCLEPLAYLFTTTQYIYQHLIFTLYLSDQCEAVIVISNTERFNVCEDSYDRTFVAYIAPSISFFRGPLSYFF